MWRTALAVGVTSALWAAGKQGLKVFDILIPSLNGLQLASVAAGIYITAGGYYTLWLAYNTLPRDITAAWRYVQCHIKLKTASFRNISIPKMFMENVRKNPNKVALIFEDQKWTFAQIDEYSNRVGNFMVKQGFKHGDVVALYMWNRPEYVCTWLGCAKVGVVPALINFNLLNDSLIHSIKVAESKALICGWEMQEAVKEVQDQLALPIFVSGLGNEKPSLTDVKCLDSLLNQSNPTPPPQIDNVDIKDKLIYIYTSGTTGLPKAAVIKHSRYLFFCAAVHYMVGLSEDEVIYNPLPLYHTAGGMVGMGQVLLFNNTAVIRRKFSKSQYWIEAKKHGCTVGQYVGELCRYLLTNSPHPEEKQHKVKVMFGNGVRENIWEEFTTRFNIPFIAEFYGATEGIANLINMEGKHGACGFLSVLFPSAIPVYLVKIEEETGEPIRDKNGLCVVCKPGEQGELVGIIKKEHPFREFHGYADEAATKKKILRNVLKPGDTAFKSGDILVQDKFGYLYFMDRTGDTFRWRGENVSTTEVEGVVLKATDHKDSVVYGVEVPGAEGRAGMTAIVDPEREIDLEDFLKKIKKSVPPYARPLFLRLLDRISVTGTFKLKKLELQKEGYNPNIIKDSLYFLDNKQGKYVPLDKDLFEKIKNCQVGL